MTDKTAKQPAVKLDIRPGGPVSNYQRTCWKKFWFARIAEAKASEGVAK